MKVLRMIDRARLREVWPWVRRGLDAICARWRQDWIPEDVYAELRVGNAQLCAIGEEGGAFCILQQSTGYEGKELFVWVLHGPCAELESDIIADLESVARAMGAKRIAMKSPRLGWRKCGFVPRETIYERAVQ